MVVVALDPAVLVPATAVEVVADATLRCRRVAAVTLVPVERVPDEWRVAAFVVSIVVQTLRSVWVAVVVVIRPLTLRRHGLYSYGLHSRVAMVDPLPYRHLSYLLSSRQGALETRRQKQTYGCCSCVSVTR